MSLIRNQNAAALTRKAVVLDLSDIAGQAELIRQQARADAEQMIRDARQLARQLSSSGNEAGYKDGLERGQTAGFKQGLADGHQQACTTMTESIQIGMSAWVKALDDFQAKREALAQEARQDVLRLALDIGERVVYRVIELENTTIENQIAETLQLLAERTAVVIQVNPADLEMAETVMPRLLAEFDHCEDITILPDDRISRGGCYLRTGKGEIDARIETQLQRILDTLLPKTTPNAIEADVNASRIAAHQATSSAAQTASPAAPIAPVSVPHPDPALTPEAEPAEPSIVDSFLSDGLPESIPPDDADGEPSADHSDPKMDDAEDEDRQNTDDDDGAGR